MHYTPVDLVGKEVPCTDGGDYGLRVIAYDEKRDKFLVQPIRWTTGKKFMDSPYWFAHAIMQHSYEPIQARPQNSE